MTSTTADFGAQLEFVAPVESSVEEDGTFSRQLSLLESPNDLVESSDYYRRQLITYIGNKRQLLDPIAQALKAVQAETGRDRLHLLDGFAGSGIVSRLFKAYAERLASNDLEPYAQVAANCFLANHSDVDIDAVRHIVNGANREADEPVRPCPGFLSDCMHPTTTRTYDLANGCSTRGTTPEGWTGSGSS